MTAGPLIDSPWATRLERVAPLVGFALSVLVLFPGFLSPRVRNGLKQIVARTLIALPALWLGAVPLVLGIADDYRYSHWLIASVWLAALLLVEVELSRRLSAAAAPSSRRDEAAPRR